MGSLYDRKKENVERKTMITNFLVTAVTFFVYSYGDFFKCLIFSLSLFFQNNDLIL